jgi:WD40 repeat protein
VDFTPDGACIVFGSSDTTVQLWNPVTSEPVVIIIGHLKWVKFVAVSPDGACIVSAAADDTVHI